MRTCCERLPALRPSGAGDVPSKCRRPRQSLNQPLGLMEQGIASDNCRNSLGNSFPPCFSSSLANICLLGQCGEPSLSRIPGQSYRSTPGKLKPSLGRRSPALDPVQTSYVGAALARVPSAMASRGPGICPNRCWRYHTSTPRAVFFVNRRSCAQKGDSMTPRSEPSRAGELPPKRQKPRGATARDSRFLCTEPRGMPSICYTAPWNGLWRRGARLGLDGPSAGGPCSSDSIYRTPRTFVRPCCCHAGTPWCRRVCYIAHSIDY